MSLEMDNENQRYVSTEFVSRLFGSNKRLANLGAIKIIFGIIAFQHAL